MVVCPPLNLGDRRKVKALRDGLKLLLAARQLLPWLCHAGGVGRWLRILEECFLQKKVEK